MSELDQLVNYLRRNRVGATPSRKWGNLVELPGEMGVIIHNNVFNLVRPYKDGVITTAASLSPTGIIYTLRRVVESN